MATEMIVDRSRTETLASMDQLDTWRLYQRLQERWRIRVGQRCGVVTSLSQAQLDALLETPGIDEAVEEALRRA